MKYYIILPLLLLGLNPNTFSQITVYDTLGKKSSFFLDITEISCLDKQKSSVYDGNLYLENIQENLSTIISYAASLRTTRIQTNDEFKRSKCISMTLKRSTLFYNKCNECLFAIEKAFNCQIIDTTFNCKVWVLKPNKKHQIKLIEIDTTTLYRAEMRQGVYLPEVEEDPEKNIICKNGILRQFIYDLENLSNHIVILKDENRKDEKFTFEISKSLIERGNFEEIKTALKEAIDFDLYEATRPIKIKYVKFLK